MTELLHRLSEPQSESSDAPAQVFRSVLLPVQLKECPHGGDEQPFTIGH